MAPSSGVLTRLDAYDIGIAAGRLGAGRAQEDPAQAAAGVELHAKPGDTVTAGQPLLTLHTDTPERFEYALESVEGSDLISPPRARTSRPRRSCWNVSPDSVRQLPRPAADFVRRWKGRRGRAGPFACPGRCRQPSTRQPSTAAITTSTGTDRIVDSRIDSRASVSPTR